MRKTTVYLPDELKTQVEAVAGRRGISEAELIRSAIADAVGAERPAPKGGLYHGREPIADRAEELLAGFGDR